MGQYRAKIETGFFFNCITFFSIEYIILDLLKLKYKSTVIIAEVIKSGDKREL